MSDHPPKGADKTVGSTGIFAEVKGVPWNMTLEAVTRGRPKKVMVHFAIPAPEAVPQKDGSLRTHAEKEELEHHAVPDEANSEPYSASEAIETPRQEDVQETSQPADMMPVEEITSGQKRSGADVEEDLVTSPTKRQAQALPAGTKRGPSIPAEALDPRVEHELQEAAEDDAKGVLQVFEHLDEATPELPEESYAHLDEDAGVDQGVNGHPDQWSNEKWAEESRKGKAKELSRLVSYGVFTPVRRRSEAKGKYVTTRWEEVPKFKNGEWIVRSRLVAREYRWQQPHRDDIFGVTTSVNTSRVLDFILAKNPSFNAYLADVECAFFHAPEHEDCVVDPPAEWLEEWVIENPGDWLWKLERQLYGRQHAPREFGDYASGVIVGRAGCERCAEVPHLYYHREEGVAIEVQINDFYAVGPGNAPERVLKEIAKHMTLQIEGPFNVDNPEFVHLKRRRTIRPDGLWIQPAEGHLRKLLELAGLDWTSKTRENPVTKPVVGSPDDEELPKEQHSTFRAIDGYPDLYVC
eukprot:s1307_g8.t1